MNDIYITLHYITSLFSSPLVVVAPLSLSFFLFIYLCVPPPSPPPSPHVLWLQRVSNYSGLNSSRVHRTAVTRSSSPLLSSSSSSSCHCRLCIIFILWSYSSLRFSQCEFLLRLCLPSRHVKSRHGISHTPSRSVGRSSIFTHDTTNK